MNRAALARKAARLALVGVWGSDDGEHTGNDSEAQA